MPRGPEAKRCAKLQRGCNAMDHPDDGNLHPVLVSSILVFRSVPNTPLSSVSSIYSRAVVPNAMVNGCRETANLPPIGTASSFCSFSPVLPYNLSSPDFILHVQEL